MSGNEGELTKMIHYESTLISTKIILEIAHQMNSFYILDATVFKKLKALVFKKKKKKRL